MINPNVPLGYAGRYPLDVLDKLYGTYWNRKRGDPHIPWGMGFGPGQTAGEVKFDEVLDRLELANQISVYSAVYERASRTGVWPFVKYLREAWDLAAGHGVSLGFVFTCDQPDELVEHLWHSVSFCCDFWPMNADHQSQNGSPCKRVTFREIVPGGTPGLHVCVVRPAFRSAFDSYGGPHGIHIDVAQIGCKKLSTAALGLDAEGGTCFYREIVEHAKTAIPYFLAPFREAWERNVGTIIASAGRLVAAGKTSREALLLEISRALPLLPVPLARMAADWLDTLISEWARRKAARD
jgi:hypothetical protein